MVIYSVAMSEHAPKDAGLRQIKYEWSFPDFWKLKSMVEYKTKLQTARMEDQEERLEQLRLKEGNP